MAATRSGLPKGDKIRDVPMTQWVYEALLEHMHAMKIASETGHRRVQNRRAADFGPDMQVIVNRTNPGRPTTRVGWAITFKLFLSHAGVLGEWREPPRRHRMSGIATDWRFHALRRFYISARHALGHPQLEILEGAGHNGLDVQFKHYARALGAPSTIWSYRFRRAEPATGDRLIEGVATEIVTDVPRLAANPEAVEGLDLVLQ